MNHFSYAVTCKIFKNQTFKSLKKEKKEKNKYNCRGLAAFKSQRVGYQSTQKLLHHYQHSKIFDHTHLKIIESIFIFPGKFTPSIHF